MGYHGEKQKTEGPGEAGSVKPECIGADQGDENRKKQRMTEPAVAETGRIRQTEAEGNHVQVRQHRCRHARSQQWLRDDIFAKPETQGKWNRRMCQNCRHRIKTVSERDETIWFRLHTTELSSPQALCRSCLPAIPRRLPALYEDIPILIRSCSSHVMLSHFAYKNSDVP